MQRKLFDLPITKKCSQCGAEKLMTKEFFYWRGGQSKVTAECKSCISTTRKAYYKDNAPKLRAKKKQYTRDNREKISMKHKAYYKDNKDKILAIDKKSYETNKDKILAKSKMYYKINRRKILLCKKAYRNSNKDKCEESRKRSAIKKRIQVIAHYSNNTNQCYCCGYTGLPFLTIDHINGDGAEHRKKVRPSQLYSWLIRNNYPDGFRVACYSCNKATGTKQICPHKQEHISIHKSRRSELATKHNKKYRILVIDHYTNGIRK